MDIKIPLKVIEDLVLNFICSVGAGLFAGICRWLGASVGETAIIFLMVYWMLRR